MLFVEELPGLQAVVTVGARPADPEAISRPLGEVKFLTVAEAATAMRVSKMTVYRLVNSGHLQAIRVGRSFRVPEPAVEAYLRKPLVDRHNAES